MSTPSTNQSEIRILPDDPGYTQKLTEVSMNVLIAAMTNHNIEIGHFSDQLVDRCILMADHLIKNTGWYEGLQKHRDQMMEAEKRDEAFKQEMREKANAVLLSRANNQGGEN